MVTAPAPTRRGAGESAQCRRVAAQEPVIRARVHGMGAERWGLTAWTAVVVCALAWGRLGVSGADVSLRAAPLMGSWAWHGGRGLLPALIVGAGVAAWGPAVAARSPWRALPPVTGLAAGAWAAALAASDGWFRLTAPLTTRHEYEPFAAGLGDLGALGAFLRDHADDLASYPVHVQGHPPGPVVVAWALDGIGLGGAGWLAALALAGWGVAAGAALVAGRELAGESFARRAAPVLAVVPAAVWAGTSLDALFAGVAACGAALAVVAVTRSSVAHAVAAGAVLGGSLLLTYGAVPLLAVPAAAALASALPAAKSRTRAGRSRAAAGDPARVLVVAGLVALGGMAVLGMAAAAGFWWPEGLNATRAAYWSGVAADRPGWYLTLAGNPGALALATGPAVAAGLAGTLSTAWRQRVPPRVHPPPAGARRMAGGAAVLPAAALVAVLVANLSQLSRGEVERIWLPFVPWLALAAPSDRRGWLVAQVVLALGLQAALRSPW